MIIKSFEDAEELAKKHGSKKISVIRAENREFLLALKEAHQRGYAEPVLIGKEKKIREIAKDIHFDISKFVVIDLSDPQEMADRGVQLAVSGETDFILRGFIDGSFLYKSLIRASSNGGIKKQICGVGLLHFPMLPKIIGISDPGVTVAPDIKQKIEIIKNCVELFNRLGYQYPKVGILCARQELEDDLESISDAAKIREAFEKSELPGCNLVDGLSLSDFFLGEGGYLRSFDEIDYNLIPDILLLHNIEIGNIFVKIFTIAARDFFSGARMYGFVMGAGITTIIPSRADTHKSILTDIALGVLIS